MSDVTNSPKETEVQITWPGSFKSLKPQLFVKAPNANRAAQFFKAAFGAAEVSRTVHPKREAEQEQPALLSVEMKIGKFSFLVSDITDDIPAPVKGMGTKNVICLETDDVDVAVAKAETAGALSEGEYGGVMMKDPYGNIWLIRPSKVRWFSDVPPARKYN